MKNLSQKMAIASAAKGMVVLIPFLVTLYVLFFLVSMVEDYFGGILRHLLPEDAYLPGLGFVLGLSLILLAGLLMQFALVEAGFRTVERTLERIPLLKSIYGSLKDFMEYFQSRSGSEQSKVVLYRPVASEPAQLVGFRTSDVADPRVKPSDAEGHIQYCTVYLPMSYQIGGYTLVVPEDRLTEVDWSFEEAMRYILTAGVKGSEAGRKQGKIEKVGLHGPPGERTPPLEDSV